MSHTAGGNTNPLLQRLGLPAYDRIEAGHVAPAIDVLLAGVQNDPIVGTGGVAATAAIIINANAASKRVMWQGIGHGASIYSSCAVPPLIGYLNDGNLPRTDIYCPA